jgi:hypothetical protein
VNTSTVIIVQSIGRTVYQVRRSWVDTFLANEFLALAEDVCLFVEADVALDVGCRVCQSYQMDLINGRDSVELDIC